jgi:hypothetical protein
LRETAEHSNFRTEPSEFCGDPSLGEMAPEITTVKPQVINARSGDLPAIGIAADYPETKQSRTNQTDPEHQP